MARTVFDTKDLEKTALQANIVVSKLKAYVDELTSQVKSLDDVGEGGVFDTIKPMVNAINSSCEEIQENNKKMQDDLRTRLEQAKQTFTNAERKSILEDYEKKIKAAVSK